MKQFGGWLFIFGAGSILLGLVGYEFSLLMWVDNWGTTVGWAIRMAMIVAGAGIWFLTGEEKAEESEPLPESHTMHSPVDSPNG